MWCPRGCLRNNGFTLIEMMIAVSVFSIGIVFVLRSFLGTASALDSIQNRCAALELLDRKMSDLEQQAYEQGGIKPSSSQEEAAVRSRKADLVSEISTIKTEAFPETINEAKLAVSWRNDARNEQEIITTYFPNKK